MQVPFLDLKTPHRRLRGELAEAMEAVMEQTAFAGGPFAAEFEASFASFCGARYGIGVGSGTEALWLALLALDVGPGDEVITVAHTFIATAEAISFTGATPVFVDIESTTYTMDPERLAAAITPRTRAIIPVHIFGQCADMDPICAIAEKHGIPVIEDAAQAHGASYGGRQAGSLGEHRFTEVVYSARTSVYPGRVGSYTAPALQAETRKVAVNASYMQVRLPPGTKIRLDLGMARFVRDPSYAFPWHDDRRSIG